MAKGSTDRRNHLTIERILNEISGAGPVANDDSRFTNRGDSSPVIQMDKRLFELKADRILPKHKLLKLFDANSVRLIVNHSLILKVRDGQALYKEGDNALGRAYIVIVGKIALKGFLGTKANLGTVGFVEGGDTLGEEGILEVSSVIRKETAIAEGDAYVFEMLKENYDKLKPAMAKIGTELDHMTL